MRSWLEIDALPAEGHARVLLFIRDWMAAADGFSVAQLFYVYSQFAALCDAAVAVSQPFDFVLLPVPAVVAFSAEWVMPTNDLLRAMEHIAHTLLYDMSEQPTASIACGHTAAGLPIGLQIIDLRHDNQGML